MALKLTVESFLQVVRQSGLIDKEQLQKLLKVFSQRGVDISKSQAIADALVGDDIVTQWQVDKLLAGKHKGFFLGKYKLLDLLGKGGMSSVYLAEHVLMRRRCAIKVLPSKRVNDTSYLARFHREAQAVASVDHPNIVRAYDVDHAQDRDSQIHFLVMEYVTGRSLQEMVMQDGPAEFADAVEYMRQAADGLEHAHRAGLVHRDIKPGNLLVDTSGTLKILDMGLARFFDDRDENPLTVAHDEKVLGTADYLAPEQALDSHTVDQRADIYSLGCSLYFMLTGHPPFTDGTLAQRLMWHQVKEFPPLTDSRLDCPASLMTLLNRMVAKKPEDRFQTAGETAEACAQWLAANASPDWRLKHIPATRSVPSKTKQGSSTRDLLSDSQTMPGSGPYPQGGRGSSIISGDLVSGSATKISMLVQPEFPSASQPVTPILATVVPTAPPVAAPVIALPVAKPVIPVAMPVVPVAQPVAPSLPVAAPISPIAQPIAVTAESSAAPPFFEANQVSADAETQTFHFGEDANVATDTEPTAPAEGEGDGDLFSLFGGNSDVDGSEVSDAQPETASLSEGAEPTSTELPLPETEPVVQDANVVPEESGSSFESSSLDSKTSKLPISPVSTAVWKQPKFLATAVGLVVLLAVGGIWAMTARGKPGNSKGTKKESQSVAKANGKAAKKSDAFEVELQVGQGNEFSNIGRAIQSILDSRAEHETKAGGKPLRFIINVTPGQPFEESLLLDESFPGELHLKSANSNRVKLIPSSNDPVISIKNLSNVTIENLSIDLSGFPPKDTAVAISGNVTRCQIKQTIISGVGKSGIVLTGAKGGEGADAIILDGVTFQNSSPTAVGIHVAKGDATQNVSLQRCRFIGSVVAALFVEGPAETLLMRNCVISGVQASQMSGVSFAAGVSIKNLSIDHCSFANLGGSAILFAEMPAGGSGNLSWRNSLFAGVKGAELLIQKNYDPKAFEALLSQEKPAANNWCDRPSPKPSVGEHDLLGEGGLRISSIEFASMDPKSDLYCIPKPNTPYKTAGVTKPK